MSDRSRGRQYPKLLVWGFGLLLLGLLLLVASAAAARDYTRSCSATISIIPQGGGTGVSHDFTGRGTVGSYMPNTARKRARRNIDECLNAHWADPFGLRPSACTESNQVYNYPYSRLHQEVQLEICNRNPARGRIFVNVRATYSGDTGCIAHPNIWNRLIREDYLIQCATQREFERGVDRPGMDYRNFETRGDALVCYNACLRESQCEAWTFVRPTTPDGPGRCWLKDGVPDARASDCCISGVKME